MKLRNLLENPEIDGYGRKDPSQNTYIAQTPNKVRKPSFTLRRLNRLKHIRATKELEQLKRENQLELIYGQSGDESGGF